ncbi:MAG: NUDIX hydrolase [Oscillospiraceae bacterium]|nr:NUDIX hydrolase [Oscillospiraceae bacterium]
MARNKMDDYQEGGLNETITDTSVVAEGRVFRYERMQVTLPDGGQSVRDVVRLPGGSVVVPIDQEGYVYLVSQYRASVRRVTLELPAGKLEPGESPEACAARELLEETGYRAGTMKHLTSILPSPGYSDEILHIFLATDLEYGEPDPDEGEFINTLMFPLDEVVDLVASGDIRDAKTVVGILLTERAMRQENGLDDIEAMD